jgi:membrane protease YdiL (CAAX protease family)
MVKGLSTLTGVFSASRSRRWRRYLRESRRPLHCLVFLAPWVLVYEVAARLPDDGHGPARDLFAHSVIQDLLGWFGLVGFWLPPVVLVATLLAWHRTRRDRWRVRWWVFPGMLLESLLLAVPLLALSALFEAAAQTRLIAALGAGIYEELVFRLLLISGLAWVLVETAQLGRRMALGVAVGLASLLFSLCHFEPVGPEPFAWRAFCFRLTAGVYLSLVFVRRGLGVSSGCHAGYNVLLAWLRGVGS